MDAYDYYINGVSFDSFCRICASPADRLIPIFKGEGKEFLLGLKIKQTLQITIYPNDDLPQCICSNCSFQIMSWYDLKLTAVKSEQQFRELLEFIEGDSNDQSTSSKNNAKKPKELPKLRLKKKPVTDLHEHPMKSKDIVETIDLIDELETDVSQDFHLKLETDVLMKDSKDNESTSETENVNESSSSMSIQFKNKTDEGNDIGEQTFTPESKTTVTELRKRNENISKIQSEENISSINVNVSPDTKKHFTKSPNRSQEKSGTLIVEENIQRRRRSSTNKEPKSPKSGDEKAINNRRSSPSKRKSVGTNKVGHLKDTTEQNNLRNEKNEVSKVITTEEKSKAINTPKKTEEDVRNIAKENILEESNSKKRKATVPRKREDKLYAVEINQEFLVQSSNESKEIAVVKDNQKEKVTSPQTVSKKTVLEWDLWESAAHELELMRRNVIPSAQKAKIKAAAKKAQEENEAAKRKLQQSSPLCVDSKTLNTERSGTGVEKQSLPKQVHKEIVISNGENTVCNIIKSPKILKDNCTSIKMKSPKNNSNVKLKSKEEVVAEKKTAATISKTINQKKRPRPKVYNGPVTGDSDEIDNNWIEEEDTTEYIDEMKTATKAVRPKMTEVARIKQESLRYGRRISRRVVRLPEKFTSTPEVLSRRSYNFTPKDVTPIKSKVKKSRVDWKINLSHKEKSPESPCTPKPRPDSPKNKSLNEITPSATQDPLYPQLKGYGCIYCPETFHRATELRKHLDMHEKQEELLMKNSIENQIKKVVKPKLNNSINLHKYPRICEICSRRYSCRQSFDKHRRLKVCDRPIGVKKVRSVRNTFPYSRMCESCHAIYHSRQSYWKHLKSNACNSTRRLPCFHPNCSIVVYHKRQMTEHLRIHHGLCIDT